MVKTVAVRNKFPHAKMARSTKKVGRPDLHRSLVYIKSKNKRRTPLEKQLALSNAVFFCLFNQSLQFIIDQCFSVLASPIHRAIGYIELMRYGILGLSYTKCIFANT